MPAYASLVHMTVLQQNSDPGAGSLMPVGTQPGTTAEHVAGLFTDPQSVHSDEPNE